MTLGYHVQFDVKFLRLKNQSGRNVKCYQYAAVGDATRIRVLQIFSKHNQDCDFQVIDYVIENSAFQISVSQPIEDMNFNPVSTGMLKMRTCSMFMSNHEHPS